MGTPAITMDVRRIGDEVAVIDIKGEVTAACEPVLMSAYEAASICVDAKRQWRHARNIWHNSAVLSVLQTIAAPVTGLGRMLRRDKAESAT